MAEILGCSTATIHSIESGRLKLSKNLAEKMFLETQISPEWLLSGDVNAPPVSARNEPYNSNIFDRAQVAKMRRNHPDAPILLFEEIGYCAMLAAILENASAKRSYFMASRKIRQALQTLRDEFGQDLEAYPSIDPHHIQLQPAVSLLTRLTVHAKIAVKTAQEIVAAREKIVAAQVKPRQSKRSSRVRKRRA